MGERGYRNKAHEAGQVLERVADDKRIAEFLTQEERDWCRILSERMYVIYVQRTGKPE